MGYSSRKWSSSTLLSANKWNSTTKRDQDSGLKPPSKKIRKISTKTADQANLKQRVRDNWRPEFQTIINWKAFYIWTLDCDFEPIDDNEIMI